ncbi:MAG: biotin-dependent carboxyltransferase family protein [Hyphomicrobiales bacterium]|nr:biotin-dependent carboxyltransferase family protein [Hyphomicrobiales bacterium]
MPIKVISAGVLTTIQDLGRPGYYHLGIPMGGAMDRYALRCANLLVGNDEGAGCLEATFMGPELEFTEDATVAVCGAELPPKVNGEEQPTWTAFDVKSGDRLGFDYLRSGARAVIAISGGIDTPVALGSRSTYAIGALGGIEGRPVQNGDTLPLGKNKAPGQTGKSVAEKLRRGPGTGDVALRMMPGLYWHRITSESQKSFLADTWKVAMEADRMGYRFQGGKPLEFVERKQPFGAGSDPSNITDACYPYGSIQVPGGTEPIILHRDAVSGGGYFMVGTIISADMDLIGQLQPATPVRFAEVDMDTALKARHDRQQSLEEVRKLIN